MYQSVSRCAKAVKLVSHSLVGSLALLGVAGVAGAGGAADAHASVVVAKPAATLGPVPSLGHPCGTLAGKPVVDQVMLVWEENHSYSSVIGYPGAPELNGLAVKCGLATEYEAQTHPSLPNYMEMTSGQSYAYSPWDTDCDPQGNCTTSAASIFSELGATNREATSRQWRSYAEGMTANCGLTSYDNYAARHNPAVYYAPIRRECDAWDQPMGTVSGGALHQALTSGPSVALTTVTPDLQDDMHDGTVAQADTWLSRWLPQVVASPGYRSGHLAVLIAWDEGSGSGNVPSHVPFIVMSASTPPGTRSALSYNDFSVLRTICQLTGVASLGQASRAPSLVGPFHL
jgi:phosphatidylinositol-3-phosphatase